MRDTRGQDITGTGLACGSKAMPPGNKIRQTSSGMCSALPGFPAPAKSNSKSPSCAKYPPLQPPAHLAPPGWALITVSGPHSTQTYTQTHTDKYKPAQAETGECRHRKKQVLVSSNPSTDRWGIDRRGGGIP